MNASETDAADHARGLQPSEEVGPITEGAAEAAQVPDQPDTAEGPPPAEVVAHFAGTLDAGEPAPDVAPEDEPTTPVPVADDEMMDEPTTVLPTAHPDLEDEPTTVLAVPSGGMDDEPTTVLAAPYEDEGEEPEPEGYAAAGDAPPPSPQAEEAPAEHPDVTEIRMATAEAAAGEAHAGSDWFAGRLGEFVAALREDEYGVRREPQDFQSLALTARDMLSRIAMQIGGDRGAADGFGSGDTVLQSDQLVANTYVVRSLIARGGVGEIYRARHRDLKTEHAIKVLLPRFSLDATMLTLMQDEARLLRLVRHDAVVFCQDLLRDADGRPMIVMDYLRGRTLSARLREGRLSPPELIVLARRLAEGLAAIHAADIVHQDISPDNVILAEDSAAAATLIDFGLARRIGSARDTHRNLDFAGKYSWSSPEQLSGRAATVDGRSDLYSLGLMLAAAARGFRLDMGNDLESARAARTTIPSLAGIEQPIAGLIEALLAPSPGARLGSAAEVAGMLEPRRGGFWSWLGRK